MIKPIFCTRIFAHSPQLQCTFIYEGLNHFKVYYPLEFVIDVSGTPMGPTTFALVSFNKITKDDVIDDLFLHFPKCRHSKGKDIDHDDLFSIIELLTKSGVRIEIVQFSGNDWHYYYENWKHVTGFKERMYAVLYMRLITRIARKGHRYTLTSCVETQAGKIDRIIHHCERLSLLFDRTLDYNYSYDRRNRGVKVADIVANAGRKVKRSKLNSLPNINIIDYKIPDWVQKYIFS